MPEKQTQKNDIAQLIQLGREQGYLTHADITDTLPDGSTDADNFEEITQVLRDMGIKVFEETPDQDELQKMRLQLFLKQRLNQEELQIQ